MPRKLILCCLIVLIAWFSYTNGASKEWDKFINEFIESHFRFNPVEGVDAGRHEYDGRLPDWSAAGLAKQIGWLKETRKSALAFSEDSLDTQQRFEREYLVARIDGDLFWLEDAQGPYRSPMFYSGATSPSTYLTRPYAPLPQRMRAYVEYAKRIPAAVGQIRANLRTPLARPHAEVSRRVFGELARYYRSDVPAMFASVDDQKLQKEFRAANDGAAKAMEELASWLELQLKEATNNYALGPELFRKMLMATEQVDVPLDRLEEIGKKDLERNLAMMKEACASYAPGSTVEECVAKVQAKKPPEGPVQGARRQLAALKQFVVDNKVVTIPGTEEAGVEEAPPYRRFNAAYIEIPGPYEKGLPSTYYIAPPDSSWSKEEQAAYIPAETELLAISVHEVWPGHFLQFLHANRSKSKFGQIFVGYAFAEGWAHYTEEMMWDAGLGKGDPEVHIGQIIHALLRNVRYLSAIGLHTKGMTVEESAKMFREKAFKDHGNASQQANRGTFDPGYLNYTLGKLMIMKLRDDWCASRVDKKAWREFHDAFLSYGGPPIPLVRKAMLGDGDQGSLF